MRGAGDQLVFEREAHVLDDRAAIAERPGEDVLGNGLAMRFAAGNDIGRQACRDFGAQFLLDGGDRPLAGRAGVAEEGLGAGRHCRLDDDGVVIGLAGRARRHGLQPVHLPGQRLELVRAGRYRLEGRDPEIGEGASGHRRRIGSGVTHQFQHELVPGAQGIVFGLGRVRLRLRGARRAGPGQGRYRRHRDDAKKSIHERSPSAACVAVKHAASVACKKRPGRDVVSSRSAAFAATDGAREI
jgi:hypothetical protein